MAEVPFNIEDAVCPRCYINCGYQDLKAMESNSNSVIFRCPSCSKPVILTNGKVKGLVN